jgi:hypothetical protein
MSYCFPDHEAFPARIRQWETAFLVMPRSQERFCNGKLSSLSRVVPRGDPVVEVCPSDHRNSLELTDNPYGSQASS